MALKQILFVCGVLCCCAAYAGEEAVKPEPVKTETAKPEAAKPEATKPEVAVPAPEPRREPLEELGAGDPFRYSVSGTDDYTPASNQRVVSGIVVKGIVRLSGQEPVALLLLSDLNRSFYVRKGSVIRASSPKNGSVATETYLQVKDIRDDEVEVIQKERPDRVIIVR